MTGIVVFVFIIILVIAGGSKNKARTGNYRDTMRQGNISTFGNQPSGPTINQVKQSQQARLYAQSQQARPAAPNQPVRPVAPNQPVKTAVTPNRPVSAPGDNIQHSQSKNAVKFNESERVVFEAPKYREDSHPKMDNNVPSGIRYESWMKVERGARIVTCGYCGAENQVGRNGVFKCYFCWKKL